MKTQKRQQYTPPQGRDLSAPSVLGANCNPGVHPNIYGSCEDGSALTSGECTPAGSSPVGGTCSPTGFIPTRGYCRTGDKAVEGCTSGSIHH